MSRVYTKHILFIKPTAFLCVKIKICMFVNKFPTLSIIH